MRYLKDVGFVIRRVNVGEYDRYVTVFSKDHGKIEMLAKGVRRISSKRSSYIELLNQIQFQSIQGPKNLVLTEVSLLDSHEEIKKNLEDMGSLFLISELIEKLCPFQQKNENIFQLIWSTLQNPMDLHQEELVFNFEVNLLTILGFWDPTRKFNDISELHQYVEGIIERKIKSSIYFGS